MTIEKLGMRKYKKKERRNKGGNSHVKCRVPAEVLGILYYCTSTDASVCFPFPSFPSDPVTNFQGNLQGLFEAYLESCSLRHAAESLLA
jgi:hypothetical protein